MLKDLHMLIKHQPMFKDKPFNETKIEFGDLLNKLEVLLTHYKME